MKPRVHLILNYHDYNYKVTLLLEEYDPVLNQPEKEGSPSKKTRLKS
jgi:hypothetical protein